MTSGIAAHRADLIDICRRYGVQRLDLFGSAAEGRESPDSDFDFLVDFGSRPAPGYADAYFSLREALEELFTRSIDLVVTSAIGAAVQDAPLCGLRRRSTSSTSSAPRR